MRLIGTLKSEYEASRISSYLQQKGIETHTDLTFDQKGQPTHQIWVLEEDRLEEAAGDFKRFAQAPTDAEFDSRALPPLKETEEEKDPEEEEAKASFRSARTPFTLFMLGLCFAIFFLNYLQELPRREENLASLFLFTPIQELLLYDLPQPFENIEHFVESHPVKPGEKIEDLAPDVKSALQKMEKTPYFRGVFDWLLLKLKHKDTSLAEGPLFIKVRQGEIWRLFSPCVLHTQFLHILFNMIWLWVLGRPIEQRIGIGKTTLLSFATGLGSNLFQYLSGGPFFLGYSGIVMGLAAFIWARERYFPWEGYPTNKMVFWFLILFIAAIFCLSFASFFLELFAGIAFAPNIANTAHIAGALIGALLGRMSWFSWHPRAAEE